MIKLCSSEQNVGSDRLRCFDFTAHPYQISVIKGGFWYVCIKYRKHRLSLRARHDQPIDRGRAHLVVRLPWSRGQSSVLRNWRSLGPSQLPGSSFPVYGMPLTANKRCCMLAACTSSATQKQGPAVPGDVHPFTPTPRWGLQQSGGIFVENNDSLTDC